MTRSLALQPHNWTFGHFYICDLRCAMCDILDLRYYDISICNFAIFLIYLVTFHYIFVSVVLACSLYLDLALFTMWHHSTIVVSNLGRTITTITSSSSPRTTMS